MGAKIIWTDEMLDTIIDKFHNTFNKDLAKELGIGQRTMSAKAKQLNLKKDADFFKVKRKQIGERIKIGCMCSPNYDRIKQNQFKRGKVLTGRPYQKGHSQKQELGEERYKEMRERMIKSRNETIKREKARIAFGLPQKTKLKLTSQSPQRTSQKYRLKKHGYRIDDNKRIAYYNDSTHRCLIMEKTSQIYTFQQEEEA